MEEEIIKILTHTTTLFNDKEGVGVKIKTHKELAKEVIGLFESFLLWKDHPKNEFNTCFNGTDKTRPRVCYEKKDKHYTLQELFIYWQKHDKSQVLNEIK